MFHKTKDVCIIFGNAMKKARTDSGMTIEEVSLESGISRNTISKWEHGRSQPDLSQLIAFFEAIHLSAMDYMPDAVSRARAALEQEELNG